MSLRPRYAPLLSETDAVALLARWGVKAKPEEVQLRPGAFGATVETTAGGRRRLLKVTRGGATAGAQLTLVAKAAEALRDAGIPAARCLPTTTGALVVAVEEKNLAARLLEWLPGAPFECGNEGQLRAAAELLARLHAAPLRLGRGLPRRDAQADADRLRHSLATLQQARDRGTGTAARWASFLEQTLALGREAHRDPATEAEREPPVLCHGDFRAQNVGFCGDEACALYDLDALHLGSPVADLAYALVFFPAVVCPRPFSVEEQRRFVESYENRRRLSARERARLPAALAAALAQGVALWLRLVDRPGGEAAVDRWLHAYREVPGQLARGF